MNKYRYSECGGAVVRWCGGKWKRGALSLSSSGLCPRTVSACDEMLDAGAAAMAAQRDAMAAADGRRATHGGKTILFNSTWSSPQCNDCNIATCTVSLSLQSAARAARQIDTCRSGSTTDTGRIRVMPSYFLCTHYTNHYSRETTGGVRNSLASMVIDLLYVALYYYRALDKQLLRVMDWLLHFVEPAAGSPPLALSCCQHLVRECHAVE
jgi:hypothetical protein